MSTLQVRKKQQKGFSKTEESTEIRDKGTKKRKMIFRGTKKEAGQVFETICRFHIKEEGDLKQLALWRIMHSSAFLSHQA